MAIKRKKSSEAALLAELQTRIAAPKLDLEERCFKEQLAFIKDASNFATACCSRRAGKSEACVADLIDTANKYPNTVSLYITLSRANAKRIIWPLLLEVNRKYELKGESNIADLSLTFPNGSVIYCSGAKNKDDINRFRGLALVLVYIDEAQAFPAFLQELVDDVISKSLYDHDGRLRVIGTPSPIPSGYFHEICHSDQWSHHAWTMLQNPWLLKKSGKTPYQLIERDLKRKGVTIEDPSIQRECFGRWVIDPNSLIFKYDHSKNHYENLPEVTGPGQWQYVMGCDMGTDDADALAVLAYHDNLPGVYLVEEVARTKQGVTELAQMIEEAIKKYSPHSIVIDAGALGKKINLELNRRFNLPIRAAEKSRKFEYIALLNDAMRTGKFFAKNTGLFAHDTMLVEKDKEKSTNDKIVVSDRFHSDISDAVLYAYRESLHFLMEPLETKIDRGTEAWYQKQKEEMEEIALRALEESKRDKEDPGAESIDKVWGED
jgi:hypothetical protein